MPPAVRRWTPGLPLHPVVRRLLGDDHIVRVALLQAGGGDADEAGLGAQLLDRGAAGEPHPRTQAAGELRQHLVDAPLVGDHPLDPLGDQLRPRAAPPLAVAISARVPSSVATLPTISLTSGKLSRSLAVASSTPRLWACEESSTSRSTLARTSAAARSR